MRSTSENADIYTARDEIYLVFAEKKVNFLFILYSTEIQKSHSYFFTWSFLVRFDFCSVFIGYKIGCKPSLHLENGLESYFNE